MADSEILQYPRGQLSLGAGDLTQVTDVSFSYTNNGKLRHTLKVSPSGKVLGNQEVTGSFTAAVDEDGPERDYFERVRTGAEVSMRLKMPNLTKSVVGFLTGVDGTIPLDDAVEFTINFAGKFSKQ